MQINIDDSVGKWVGSIVTVCSVIFAVFIFMDERHLHQHDKELVESKIEQSDSKVRQRILMSESTRYAEVQKYYYELKQERDLTLAEMQRLRLVEEQQRRIEDILLGTTED